jgi:hypothetical protein
MKRRTVRVNEGEKYLSLLVFRVISLCGLTGRYQPFWKNILPPSLAMKMETVFLQNVGICLQVHIALQSGRPTLTSSLL